jgi:hypothetical protein
MQNIEYRRGKIRAGLESFMELLCDLRVSVVKTVFG